MSQHPRAIQTLPPERLIRQAVELVPANLVRDEVSNAGARDQLRQRPGITKRVGQPENRRLDVAKALPEISPAKQKLPHQRFGPAGVAIRLDPRTADHFPAALGHALADLFEQRGLIL